MKKTIVFVTYAMGREGTSALMGLINTLGIPVTTNYKDIRNPKGYFEDPDYIEMLKKELPAFFDGPLPEPPSMEDAEANAAESMETFREYFKKNFVGKDMLAIKSPKYICIFQMAHLMPEYDFKVIVTQREMDAMVKSLQKMWSQSKGMSEKHLSASPEDIAQHIQRWRDFGDQAMEKYSSYEYFHTSFEDIMNEKYATAQKLADFVGVTCPPQSAIEEWLDDKLVSRKEYKGNFFQKSKFRLNNFLMKLRQKMKS